MNDQRWEVLDKIGNGAFGEVYRAKDTTNGRVVALKKVRLHDDGKIQVLPAAQFQELEALRQLQHPNVVQLLDVYPGGTQITMVLEYLETDLFSVIRKRSERFEDAEIRYIMRMLLHAVAYCHRKGIMHRDIKPANLLMNRHGILKLSDFGLATVFVGSDASYSHQVATRWYRAPELLYGARHYDFGVDLWSVGTIFAELLHQVPLFAGQNDIDQLYRIIQVLGNPESQWPEVQNLPDFNKVSFPSIDPIPLDKIFADTTPEAIDLLTKLLAINPKQRISAHDALRHPYFFAGSIHPLTVTCQTNDEFSTHLEQEEFSTLRQRVPTAGYWDDQDPFLASLSTPLYVPPST